METNQWILKSLWLHKVSSLPHIFYSMHCQRDHFAKKEDGQMFHLLDNFQVWTQGEILTSQAECFFCTVRKLNVLYQANKH